MTAHAGSCHCGAVRFRYDTDRPLAVRECQCSFCRKHGSRNVSDPGARAQIVSSLPMTRYRFGLGITDFLICPRCGSYVAAAMCEGGRCWSTLNLNCFDDPQQGIESQPMVYDSEGAEDRLQRRRSRWTPTSIEEPSTSADT